MAKGSTSGHQEIDTSVNTQTAKEKVSESTNCNFHHKISANGNIYKGGWKQDKENGEGWLTVQGITIHGIWEEGTLVEELNSTSETIYGDDQTVKNELGEEVLEERETVDKFNLKIPEQVFKGSSVVFDNKIVQKTLTKENNSNSHNDFDRSNKVGKKTEKMKKKLKSLKNFRV